MSWYERDFRRNLVDMHIDDWDDAFFSKFDPEAYYDCLKRAHVSSTMIYLQSHVGLCNWSTKSGRTHRAFQHENKVRRLIDLCHDGNISVIGYYSLIYNNVAFADHPSWRTVDVNGKPSRADQSLGFMTGGRYGLVCPNNEEYRKFVRTQLAELFDAYPLEGIFLDMTFWPVTCYCPSCQARYKNETGKEIPRVVDWADEEWKAFQRTRQAWMTDFAQMVSAEIHRLRPQVSIEHQFSTICHYWGFGVDGGVNAASDYAGGDLYGGYLSQSYICKVFREATRNQPFEYMTSRCRPGLRVHTMTKPLYMLRRQNLITLAHHGAFLVIDAIDPVGTLNPRVYDRIGQVFEESMPYEKYLKGDLVSEVALIMSYDSKYDPCAKPAAPDAASKEHTQLKAQLAIAQIMREERMTYTVLPGDRLNRLPGHALAVMTSACQLRDDEREAIEQYVREGGKLYASGDVDERLMKRLIGLHYQGWTKEAETYFAPTEAGQAVFGEEFSAAYPAHCDGCQRLAQIDAPHTVLSTITLPRTDPADRSIFASIHSNPPMIPTSHPAMVLADCGKGKVIWAAAPFELGAPQIVRNALALLAKPGIIASDAHPAVEFTLFKDGRDYLLSAFNASEVEPPMAPAPFTATLKLPAEVESVVHLPDEQPVPWTADEQGVHIPVNLGDMFMMLRIRT